LCVQSPPTHAIRWFHVRRQWKCREQSRFLNPATAAHGHCNPSRLLRPRAQRPGSSRCPRNLLTPARLCNLSRKRPRSRNATRLPRWPTNFPHGPLRRQHRRAAGTRCRRANRKLRHAPPSRGCRIRRPVPRRLLWTPPPIKAWPRWRTVSKRHCASLVHRRLPSRNKLQRLPSRLRRNAPRVRPSRSLPRALTRNRTSPLRSTTTSSRRWQVCWAARQTRTE
jgi:hypothetical protein